MSISAETAALKCDFVVLKILDDARDAHEVAFTESGVVNVNFHRVASFQTNAFVIAGAEGDERRVQCEAVTRRWIVILFGGRQS